MNTEATPGENHTGENLLPVGLRRFAPILGAIVLGLALFGFLSGIREPQPTFRPEPVVRDPDPNVPAAVSYAEIPGADLRPNARLNSSLGQLKYDQPGIFTPVVRTEEMRQAALADRARNRAYDGAPPTIPHPVEAQSAAACLACHGEGLKVGDRLASRISHATLSNCTQCHVEQAPQGFASTAPVENDFLGIYRAGPGQRASPGAPPTIPHSTWMRDNCASCHGLVTRPGTRTTHPWLTNCTQCHAPSAALDQVDFLGGLK
jgi:cytochrome c-type protein NapB